MSILRRDSVSSDSGDALAISQTFCLPNQVVAPTEERTEVGFLQAIVSIVRLN